MLARLAWETAEATSEIATWDAWAKAIRQSATAYSGSPLPSMSSSMETTTIDSLYNLSRSAIAYRSFSAYVKLRAHDSRERACVAVSTVEDSQQSSLLKNVS